MGRTSTTIVNIENYDGLQFVDLLLDGRRDYSKRRVMMREEVRLWKLPGLRLTFV